VNDDGRVSENLRKALACPVEGNWMIKTTMDSLRRLSETRKARNQQTSVVDKYFSYLHKEFEKRNG